MDQAWDGACGPWPSTARVQVRELSPQSLHNPQPRSKAPGHCEHGHSGQLAEECLSPTRLALAQEDDLQLVSMLEMCVNTRENSLGSFGLHLPNLSQLKLNGSCLGSLRDLGTSLGHLHVLWLARCGLADLDGISSFPALKELYLSYNDIWDLSPLCLLEHLEVLDLEGNCVEDLGQLRYLQLCPRLATLTLEGNPLCLRPGPGPTHQVPRGYNYRAEVRKLIPQLQVLDELPAAHTGLPASWKLDQDWLLVKEAIKEGCILDSLLPGTDRTHGSPMWSLSPELCLPETQPRAPRRWPLSLLVPGVPLPEGLLPKGPAPEDDASNLTHGTGRVLCGNPTKGLQERRHQCQAGVHPEKLPPPRLEELAPRASAPRPDPADDRDLLACAGLQALRELHLQWVPPTPHPSPATLCALIRGGLWLGPALAELLLVPGWLEGRVTGAQGWGTSPKSHSSGICSKEGAGCSLPQPHPSPLPSRCPESWEEGAAAPWGPQKGPEEQEDKAGPKPHRSPPSLAPESSRTSGYNLIPCPPKSSMPDRGCSSRGSADLQFRGRRLRTLGSLEPGLGQRLAPVTALRAREVTSGPSPQAEGCPGPKPAPDSAARPPASGACRT
ncbi:leucine-rich repeat-containing protein 56 isoform X2 [Odocoileus virginianus]|uniref:Leucine-rich repeat-containing protein 56 isoform X2 n=1 Tax=Odocoileus virginianus TaxID=9874 RepID=A0ABM4HER0_ODOVR